jgi:hypothetical protein
MRNGRSSRSETAKNSVAVCGGFDVGRLHFCNNHLVAVFAWKRETDMFDFEGASSAVASYPMQLTPLIAGNDKAKVDDLVYLTRVLLKPGPTPKVFFVAGSQGTQILTVAEADHVFATPGEMVDVRGTIRNTPAIGVLRKQWKLSAAEAKRVSQIPIYIESSFIRESDD